MLDIYKRRENEGWKEVLEDIREGFPAQSNPP